MNSPAIEAAAARAGLYSFLARIFAREVDEELLGPLLAPETAELLRPFAPTFESDLRLRLERDGRDRLLEDLAVEYSRLFLGPGRHLDLCESVQRPDVEEAQHWGPHTVEVKRFIEHHGFHLFEDDSRLPDHLSVELDFLAGIVGAELQARRDGDGPRTEQARLIEKTFLREHLLVWGPRVAAEAERESRETLYREVARITRRFLDLEAVEFGIPTEQAV